MEKRKYSIFTNYKTKCPPSMMMGGKGTHFKGKCLPKKFSCPKGTKYNIKTDQCIKDT